MFNEQLEYKNPVISVIGLGYVGLPLALAFAKKTTVVGFDIDKQKIERYKSGIDITNEVGNVVLKKTSVEFTSDEEMLKKCNFHIVTVPTPVKRDNTPDLNPLITACEILGRNLERGSIVVLESTVFPGATEEICVPVLEKASGLKHGVDFKAGYSPERINPGDKKHRLDNVVRIASGMDEESLDIIAKTYEMIITAGIFKASSIKVAEAAKVIENTQRDVNIAFINEVSIILNKMGIDTYEVLEAAGTKWNFSKFNPGLVGGHCISVDPYYFISKALDLGYSPNLIISARKVNNSMGKFIAEITIKLLLKAGINLINSKLLIMGITFKENVTDIRNSGIICIMNELKNYGIEVVISDPLADKNVVRKEYGIDLIDPAELKDVDAVIIAVAHDEYKKLDLHQLKKIYRKAPYILIDIKKLIDKQKAENEGYLYLSL